jgi:hypothetical protein
MCRFQNQPENISHIKNIFWNCLFTRQFTASVSPCHFIFSYLSFGISLNAENEKDIKYRRMKAVLDLKFPDVKVNKQQ